MTRAPDTLPDPTGCRIPTLHEARESLEPPGIWRHDPADVRALLKARGISGSDAASLIGVSPRGFRQWTADPDTSTARTMSYSAWAALVLLSARAPDAVPDPNCCRIPTPRHARPPRTSSETGRA